MQKIAFAGFTWDKANHSKCQKHGVSVAEVEYVLAHTATLILPDIRNSRAEPRFLAIGRTEKGGIRSLFSRRGKPVAEYSCGQ